MKNIVIGSVLSVLLTACNSGTDGGHGSHTDTAAHQQDPGADTASGHNKPVGSNEMVTAMRDMMMDMHHAKPTGNNDVDFATMMMAHHKGAVVMAQVQLDKGQDETVKNFSRQVISDQGKEINFFNRFIAAGSSEKSDSAETFTKALNNSMMAMMTDSTPIFNNIDKDFAAQMIPHHQSAVDMAKVYLAFGHNKEMIVLSHNIVKTQTKEIAFLRSWLSKGE